jgi:AAA ATPase domain
VAVFDARTGAFVSDRKLLAALGSSDASIAHLAFDYVLTQERLPAEPAPDSAVVEVEFGESWTDYRPARPEHFVGRAKIQRDVLRFLTAVKIRRSETRVFAIKGDSGIGKSSLVAKLRDRANKSRKPSGVFMFAVDVRAANTRGYVHASLLMALRRAAELGFGTRDANSLRVTDVSDPLQSDSIRQFLHECERRKQLLVLVFDQFEELYSKPELFGVFEEARRLMFSAMAAGTNFVLGFAWKTDSTVPQDHPAYYMWHQLADHRYEATLSPFTHGDAENSLRLFEKELHSRLRPELRKYVIEQSQGFPWLLKKLCIHLSEQLRAGATQNELADRSLDIGFLFDRDLSSLTQAEDACIKLIARNAPIDWYEVLETAGTDVVRSLQDKRLVIRRGDKLNIYWDIFKEYVLSRSIPHIPFTHVPQSPSVTAFLNVASDLDPAEPRSIDELGPLLGYSANTVGNIIHDLSEFGVVVTEESGVVLDQHLADCSPSGILGHVRLVLRRHALTAILRQRQSALVTQENMIQFLKRINPAAKHHSRTWRTYANRMGQWLTVTGYLKQYGSDWMYDDGGEIQKDYNRRLPSKGSKRYGLVFIGDAPPARVVEALEYIRQNGPQSVSKMKSLGFRNACAVLFRFGLLETTTSHEYRLQEAHPTTRSSLQAVWEMTSREQTLQSVLELLREKPSASAVAVGQHVAKAHQRDWTPATHRRIGNSLRQWTSWLLQGEQRGSVPEPPGPQSQEQGQADLPLF